MQSREATSLGSSFAWVGTSYVAATAVGVCTGWLARRILPALSPFGAVVIGDLAATATVFGFSRAFDNSSFYDPYWSIAPMVYAPILAWGAGSKGNPARKALVVSLVMAWGARLTANWARGWQGLSHEDWRYVDLRNQNPNWYWPISFAGLHTMPTVLVLLGSLPMVSSLVSGDRPMGWRDVAATVVTAGAIVLETVADEQLRAFRKNKKEPGEIMAEGLWAHSRHPNYLGEIGFWWGMDLFGRAASEKESWRSVGATAMTALFKFISIPLIDKRSLKRRPSYAEHMKRVPALLPRWWPFGSRT